MNPPSNPFAIWVERYESLRQYILKDRHVLQTEPLSLLLWLSHGMAAWMHHWAGLAQGAAQPPAASPLLRCPATSVWQQQLTLLLAQITAHHLQPNPNP
jgi:hypothetical protein